MQSSVKRRAVLWLGPGLGAAEGLKLLSFPNSHLSFQAITEVRAQSLADDSLAVAWVVSDRQGSNSDGCGSAGGMQGEKVTPVTVTYSHDRDGIKIAARP